MKPISRIFVTCSKGIEDILQTELKQLAITGSKVRTGGVSFEGDVGQAMQACMWSRVASRILLQLKAFEVGSEDDLYREIASINWQQHFDESNTLAIDCFSSHPAISNSHYATLRIKDAIVDRFMEKTGARPSIDKSSPDVRINVYLSESECFAYLDLSGDSLHRRGYRQSTGRAPMRETLAAAILYRAKWSEYYDKQLPLYDPMCGSATLLIEGALMAADIAPGLMRHQFGFHHWKHFDEQQWRAIVEEAEQKKEAGLLRIPIIRGSDIDEKMVGFARQNIKAAGLLGHIKVSLQDATKQLSACKSTEQDASTANAHRGLIVCNPPYGKRIGQSQMLRTLYHRFGQQLKKQCNGWSIALITSEQMLAKSLGLRAFRKNTLYNGALKSTLYQYQINAAKKILDDEQADNGQILPENNVEAAKENTEYAAAFANRLTKNYKHIKKWARRNDISCYRVYDADIPQYAVAIDKYEDWVHVQEYHAPKTVDKNRAFQRINDVINVTADILEVPEDNVVLKVRRKQEGSDQYQKLDQKDQRIEVQEGGLRFLLNMHDYIDTGLFLDHRQTREMIRRLSRDKDFLNLFAYTGSVSVYAADGGAKSVTTVDMSNTYLNWAKDNMALNGFSSKQYRFEREDCLKWIAKAIETKQKYQLVFIDPPTFSNSKKMDTSLDIVRDHVALLSGCLALLADQGILIFSTNARGFKLDQSIKDLCETRQITTLTMTEDFRKKPLHHCWALARDKAILKVL